MNIRDAVLAAADHIERNPGEFNWNKCGTPERPGCGTPGCALGWIHAFLGIRWTDSVDTLGVEDDVFYTRMSALAGYEWRVDTGICAAALRKYADTYHAAPRKEKKGIPADILAIFNRSYTAQEVA